ncbi:PREDICTED: peptide methionine sulfoxide reductase A4, chloroplastic isoform X1 [Camelina sativa]|uniref:peptide-methionine (S)-S-oxide reductase n=1 Tax=Camelina sativa TaxID=90675 RepID=A0ABM0UZ89_CAMSA|nr:PREDICTED: peptide methionine sulfoxide reductase A4, chloroplastic isoform X1 [Camelina sativa]
MQVLVASPPFISAAALSKPLHSLSKAALPFSRAKPICPFPQTSRRPISVYKSPMNNLFNRLGFGSRPQAQVDPASAAIAQGPDDDVPSPGQQFAQFGAGCFWGLELAYQRVPGVTKTEVGYSHGFVHNPSYGDVCSDITGHNEVVRVQYDPKDCSFESLLDVFWKRHDPTTLNRQGNDVGTQYRSGIYYYTEEQERIARESVEIQEKILNKKIVTELLPATKFYRAEEHHQQYLAKGGRMGLRQSPEKGCKDPIRCYG